MSIALTVPDCCRNKLNTGRIIFNNYKAIDNEALNHLIKLNGFLVSLLNKEGHFTLFCKLVLI